MAAVWEMAWTVIRVQGQRQIGMLPKLFRREMAVRMGRVKIQDMFLNVCIQSYNITLIVLYFFVIY